MQYIMEGITEIHCRIYTKCMILINMTEATSSLFNPHEPKTLSECPYHTPDLINILVNCEVAAGTPVAG
jgi:hypothetical protein